LLGDGSANSLGGSGDDAFHGFTVSLLYCCLADPCLKHRGTETQRAN